MSMALNLGEVTTNSGSGNLQRSPQNGVETQGVRSNEKLPKPCYRIVADLMKKIIDSNWPLLILCETGLLSDSLFFFIPVIGHDKKCIRFDRSLVITACALRTVTDFLYTIFYSLFQLPKVLQKDKWRYLSILIELLRVLPLPQVIVAISIIAKMRSRTTSTLILIVLLMQFQPRFLRLFTTIELGTTEFSLAKLSAVFFFLYIYSSQTFGALWYAMAINTEEKCWEEACRNQTRCSRDFFNCDQTFEVYKFLNDFCSRNTTNYDFGISRDAHQSGILEKTGSFPRILYSFRWALQNLSNFGQNLEVGSDVIGNIWALLVIMFGLHLFLICVGMIQHFIERLLRVKKKWRETQRWRPFKNLTEDIQSQVKKFQTVYIWTETEGAGANIKNLFNNLPMNLRRKMTHNLCIELLKKVEEFGRWNEASLETLCSYLKPVFYIERTRIIREGDPIDEIIFVVDGRLWSYTSTDKTASSPGTESHDLSNAYLKTGDFCGKELVNRIQADAYTFNLPVSPRTIQAVTDVDAFVLMAHDLKDIFIKRHGAALCIQWRWRRFLRWRRFPSLRREAQNPAQEQNSTDIASAVNGPGM